MTYPRIKTGRDPFARQSIHKYRVYGHCQWCGESKHGKTWAYYLEPDRYYGRVETLGQFCSVDCLNNYHN